MLSFPTVIETKFSFIADRYIIPLQELFAEHFSLDLPCLPTQAPVAPTVTTEVPVVLPTPIGPISLPDEPAKIDPIGPISLPKVEEPPQLPPNWVEERFRVDRRKLEEMILGKSNNRKLHILIILKRPREIFG